MTAPSPNQDDRREIIILVVGVTLSIALGIVFFVRSNDKNLNAAIAASAGLIVITITLQLESMVRERRKSGALTRQQRLIAEMEEIDWLPEIIGKMVTAASAVEHIYHETAAIDLSKRAFEECLFSLEDLKGGHFEVPFDDMWLMHSLIERTSKSILATSIDLIDLPRWGTAAGQRYWNLNVRALERGVKIQRIYIYREWSTEHERLVRHHNRCGVRTLRVHIDQLSPRLQLDMVIWDQQCAYESRTTAHGEGLTMSYTFSQATLRRMIDHYKTIQDAAELWPETSNDDGPYL